MFQKVRTFKFRFHSIETTTVSSPYFKVPECLKLLMSQSKFSGPRKFTLRHQKFEISGVEMQRNIGGMTKLSSLITDGTLRCQCSTY